jgi:hypothetical protein
LCQIAIAALSAASSLAKGVAERNAAKAQARAAETNSRLAEEQAADALRRGAHEENKFRREMSVLQGSQRAASAASGVDVDSGSASDLQREARMEEEDDAAVIRFNAARENWAYNTQALDYRNQARAARSAGKNAMAAGVIGAGASFLSLAAPWYKEQEAKKQQASERASLRRKELAESWNKTHKSAHGGYLF